MEAVDFGEATELVGGGGVLRVDSADTLKGAWVAFEDAGKVAVVPFVVDDLDDDGAEDVVGVHQLEELFDGGVFGGRIGSVGEGEGGVVLPHMDVRVDERGVSCC